MDDNLQEKIDDIVDAGILEIELKFMEFKISMENIELKHTILENIVIYNLSRYILITSLKQARTKHYNVDELINYTHEIYEKYVIKK